MTGAQWNSEYLGERVAAVCIAVSSGKTTGMSNKKKKPHTRVHAHTHKMFINGRPGVWVWVTRSCYGPVRGWCCEGEFNTNFLQYSESFCLGNFISMMFCPPCIPPPLFFNHFVGANTDMWEENAWFPGSGCEDGELTLIYTLWFPHKLPSLFILSFFFSSVCLLIWFFFFALMDLCLNLQLLFVIYYIHYNY